MLALRRRRRAARTASATCWIRVAPAQAVSHRRHRLGYETVVLSTARPDVCTSVDRAWPLGDVPCPIACRLLAGPKRTPAVKRSRPGIWGQQTLLRTLCLRSAPRARAADTPTMRRLSGTAQIIARNRAGPRDAFNPLIRS